VTAALGLDSYEYRIDLRQGFWIITFQDPAFSCGVVFVENAQIDGSLAVRATPAPRLERARSLDFGLLIEIVRVENQRLAPGIKDSTVGLLRLTCAGHIIDFCDGKIAGTEIVKKVRNAIDLRPRAMIERLQLLNSDRIQYLATAKNGHFGNSSFPWEQTDLAADLA